MPFSLEAQQLQRVALFLPALLLSLSVHEYAHALSATRLGDDTPGRQGRLTLSPVAHIDVFGSLIFPVLLILFGGFVFGWARPVQFNPARFSRKVSMRTGSAITAAAGPLSNVGLALVAVVLLRITAESGLVSRGGTGLADVGYKFLWALFSLNVLLAVFNLFPLPPLDGHYFLPRSIDHITDWLRRYSFLLFFAVFFIPLPGLGSSIGLFIMSPIMSGLQTGLMKLVGL
jgi:Zn-dependent protease